jgi:hypothetical protein
MVIKEKWLIIRGVRSPEEDLPSDITTVDGESFTYFNSVERPWCGDKIWFEIWYENKPTEVNGQTSSQSLISLSTGKS